MYYKLYFFTFNFQLTIVNFTNLLKTTSHKLITNIESSFTSKLFLTVSQLFLLHLHKICTLSKLHLPFPPHWVSTTFCQLWGATQQLATNWRLLLKKSFINQWHPTKSYQILLQCLTVSVDTSVKRYSFNT